MKKVIFTVLMLAIIWKWLQEPAQVKLGPGVMVSESPIQEKVGSGNTHQVDDYTITEVAKFEIKAKVLARKNYSFSRGSDLSPVDFALGWGNMSDESVLDKIEISQLGRFYFWQVKEFPIPRREIETHSANMHIIPANDDVESELKHVRSGDIIQIQGALVNVNSNNWYWESSITRDDTGNGACELVWVEQLTIHTKD